MAELVPVDHDPFAAETFVPPVLADWAKQAAGKDVNILSGAGQSLLNTIAAPGRAYQSTTPIPTEQMIAPAFDLAALTMGGGAGGVEDKTLRETVADWAKRAKNAIRPAEGVAADAAKTVPAAAAGKAPVDVGPGVAESPGGGEGVQQAQLEAERRAAGRQALPGLPQDKQIVEGKPFIPGPVASVQDVADRYMADKNFGMPAPEKFHELDKTHSRAIAKAFDEMKHAPNDPAVKASYEALIRETLAQYQAIKNSGLEITPVGAADYPYHGNPRAVAKDVADNNHMAFFKTDEGFGTGEKADPNNPMLRSSGEKIGDHDMLNNDLFRVVHDYFGHIKNGYGFRAAGEDNAWRSHAAMYSPEARPAMTSETRGQNSWVNYGPHGDFNRTASGADTIYSPQKVGLMPEWTMQDRAATSPMLKTSPETGGADVTLGSGPTEKKTAAPIAAVPGMLKAPQGSKAALDMNQDARLARAGEQGYDTSTPFYHGTSKDADFNKFKDSRHGTWTTTDPAEASAYAKENDSKGPVFDNGKIVDRNTADRVLPLYGKPLQNPYTGPVPDSIRTANNYKKAQSDWFDQLKRQGYDGVDMGGGVRVDFNNANLRSQFAPFDPKNQGKSMLLGSGSTDKKAAAAIEAAPGMLRTSPETAPSAGVRDRGYYEGEPVINAGVDAPTNKRIQTVADPYRMMFPGIYRNPKIIADEAAAQVGPEDIAMKRLFGVTRGDLREMNMGRVGNEEPNVSLAKNPRGSLAAQNIQTPQNTQRLQDILYEVGRHEGLRTADAWYVMDPMYWRLKEMFGPEEAARRYKHLSTMTGMASPGSNVLTEIQRGTGAHWLEQQGRFNDFAKYGGLEGEARQSLKVPSDLRYIQGHPYHKTSQVGPMQKYLDTGAIQSESPKVPLYTHASGVPETGFQTTGPVGDAHFSRGVGLADTREGPTDVGASFSRAEYQTLQPWWQHDVAGKVGLESVPGQARLWTGLGPQTGVESELGAPKLELFAKQIMKAAARLGISPEKARDLILSGKAGAGVLTGAALAPSLMEEGDGASDDKLIDAIQKRGIVGAPPVTSKRQAKSADLINAIRGQ